MKKTRFASVQAALVPIAYAGQPALAAALALAPRVHLLGVVRLAPDQPLSAGADAARQVRTHLRAHAAQYGERVRVESPVIVSYEPWRDLQAFAAEHHHELLVLEWPAHLEALGVSAPSAGHAPATSCSRAVPREVQRVLVAVRGGPRRTGAAPGSESAATRLAPTHDRLARHRRAIPAGPRAALLRSQHQS
jgi:hypothetical protein